VGREIREETSWGQKELFGEKLGTMIFATTVARRVMSEKVLKKRFSGDAERSSNSRVGARACSRWEKDKGRRLGVEGGITGVDSSLSEKTKALQD